MSLLKTVIKCLGLNKEEIFSVTLKMNLYIFGCFMLIFAHASAAKSTKKVCDVRVWYLNLITDDIFNIEMNHAQLQLKNSIEALVMKAAESEETRRTDCHILYMYNDMLKSTFSYSPSEFRSRMDVLEEEVEVDDSGSIAEDKEKGQTQENETSKTEDSKNNTLDEKNKNTNDNMGEEEDVKITASNSDQEPDEAPVKKEEKELAREDEKDETEDESEIVDETECDEECEENMDDREEEEEEEEEEKDRSIPILASSTSVENNQTQNNETGGIASNENVTESTGGQLANTSNTMNITNFNKTKEDSVLFAPTKLFWRCKINVCYKPDIFDSKSSSCNCSEVKMDISQKNKRNNAKVLVSKTHCVLGNVCNSRCYFVMSLSYCMIGYDYQKFLPETKATTEQPAVLQKQPKDIDKVSTPESGSTNNIGKMAEDEIPFDIDKLEKQLLGSDQQDTKSTTKQNEEDNKTPDTGTRNDPFPLEKFENILHKTTSEYNNKIQSVEIMIMKLENQVLMEKLNKQNHSSTITRLENLILKLENDLLRMNKNYEKLKEETEKVSQKQGHYLEIAQKYQESLSKYPALPDHSAQKLELVTEHQAKIKELTDVLHNQSSVISVMKNRSEYLEDQNRILHQMVMNQTAFMAQIIQRVQDLSEQNSKQKEETNGLKQKLELALVTNKLLKMSQSSDTATLMSRKAMQTLDHIVSDKNIKLSTVGNDDATVKDNGKTKEKEDDSDVELKNYLKQKATDFANWCPANNITCPACIYHTVLASKKCIPFRPLIWTSCSNDVTPKLGEAVKPNSDKHDMKQPLLPNTQSEGKGDTVEQGKELVPTVKDPDTVKPSEEKPSEQNSEEGNNNKEKDETKIPVDDNKSTSGNLPHDDSSKSLITEAESSEHKDMETNENRREETEKTDEISSDVQPINKEAKETAEDHKQPVGVAEKQTNKDHVAAQAQLQNSSGTTDSSGDSPSSADKPAEAENKTISVKDEPQKSDLQNDKKDNVKMKEGSEEAKSAENISDVKKEKSALKKKTKGKATAKAVEKVEPLYVGKAGGQREPKDCYDYYQRGNRKDGVFKVKPLGSGQMIQVFCDMKKGGWTLIQKRQDGTTKFFKDWDAYKKGFGGLYGEHWLGNDYIHQLTNQDYYTLRVDLQDWNKNKRFAEYDYFLVEPEEQGYRLHVGGYSGDAGDGLTKHSGSKFSTSDVDNDMVEKDFGGSCAKRFQGAGWYYKCYSSNLNGKYYRGGKIPEKQFDGVTWKPWTGPNYSMKTVEMKLRPRSAKD